MASQLQECIASLRVFSLSPNGILSLNMLVIEYRPNRLKRMVCLKREMKARFETNMDNHKNLIFYLLLALSVTVS